MNHLLLKESQGRRFYTVKRNRLQHGWCIQGLFCRWTEGCFPDYFIMLATQPEFLQHDGRYPTP